jgi:hypothetical protein
MHLGNKFKLMFFSIFLCINIKNKIQIILIYFQVKNIFKNILYHNIKHAYSTMMLVSTVFLSSMQKFELLLKNSFIF